MAHNKLKLIRPKKTLLLFVGLCALSFAAASSMERYVIAYLPYGGGWSSRIMLSNPSDQATNVELLFFSAGERPLTLSESATGDRALMRLDAGATQSVEINSIVGEPTGLAWAIAQSEVPLQVFSTFDYSVPETGVAPEAADTAEYAGASDCPTCVGQMSSGQVDQMGRRVGPPVAPPGRPADRPPSGPKPGRPVGRPPVSVPVTTPVVIARVANISGATILPSGRGFVFPVSVYGSKQFNAFLAIANPNESDAAVSLNLSYADGLQKLNRVVQLPPRGQMTRLLTDTSLFNQLEATPDGFDGTVTLCSNVPIGVVAIGLAGELAYTLPVTRSEGCPGTN